MNITGHDDNPAQSPRQRRFAAIAREEASIEGYRKYAPITRGPLLNALLIGMLAMAAPFYITWRGLKENPRVMAITGFCLLVLVLGFVYWKHFDNAFQFDDSHTIVNNQYIRDIGNIPRFFTDVESTSSLPTNQSYRPIVTLENAIDYRIAGGLDTRVFHGHIFIDFILTLALTYFMAVTLFRMSGSPSPQLPALMVVAFFGLHTATAETINYIIARSDVVSTLMVLAGMLIFMRCEGWRKHLAILPFVVGCLTKPTALMLAPLLALYVLIMPRPSPLVRDERPAFSAALGRAARQTGIYFVIGAGLYLFTQSMNSQAWTPGGNFSGLEYLNTQAWVVWIYLRTFILPTGLSADTDLAVIREYLAPRVLWGLFVIAVLLACAWLGARRRSTLPITFGILWFFIALVPSSSIIPLAEVMNHHRTFFPYIGLAIALVWALVLLFRKLAGDSRRPVVPWLTGLVVMAVLAAHGWGTMQRVEVWHSPESLWRDVTVKSPDNGRGLMNYGLALMQRGDLEGAIEYYQRARNTNYGNHPYLYINLAIATDAMARRDGNEALRDEAETWFREALRLGPNYPEPHFRYADWLQKNGRADEALVRVNQAIELSPANANALALRERLTQSAADKLSSALEHAQRNNTPAAWIDFSLVQYNMGDFGGTIESARKALALDPKNPYAWNNICSAHNRLGEFAQAIAACEESIRLAPDFERARNNLEWARRQQAGQ